MKNKMKSMKSKRFIRWLALLLCLLTIIPTTVIAQGTKSKYSGGSGTKEDPWIIATAEDLNAMGNESKGNKMFFAGEYFKQTADIDMKKYPKFEGICGLEKTKNNKLAVGFAGRYDGGGHVISNMTIDRPRNYCVGLFGEISYYVDSVGVGAIVHDVHLDSSCKIIGKGQVGGIVGLLFGGQYSTTSVYNCTSGASVFGTHKVGGIVGDIMRSDQNYQGANLSVWHCLNYGSVTKAKALEDAAGVVGNISSGGQIIECMNLGTINAPQTIEVGGVTGFYGPLGQFISGAVNCVNYGYVHGARSTGGVVGLVRTGHLADFKHGSFLLHCLNVGAVTSNDPYVGNIVGKTYGANLANSGTKKMFSVGNVYDKQEYTLRPIATTTEDSIKDVGCETYYGGVNAQTTKSLVSGEVIDGLERGEPSLDELLSDDYYKVAYHSNVFKLKVAELKYEGYSYKKGKYPTLAYWVRENDGEKSTFEQSMASSEKAQEECHHILTLIDNARSTYLQFRDEDKTSTSHAAPYEDADGVGHIATVYPKDAASITKIVLPKNTPGNLFKIHDDTGKQLDPEYRLEVKQYADTVWLKNGDFEKPVFVKNALPKRIHLFVKNNDNFSFLDEEQSTLAPKNVSVKYWTTDIYGENQQVETNAGGAVWPAAVTSVADYGEKDYVANQPYYAVLKDGRKMNTVFSRRTPQASGTPAIDAGYFLYDVLVPASDGQPMTVTVDDKAFTQDVYGTDIVSHSKSSAARTDIVSQENAWYLRTGVATHKDKDKDTMTDATGPVKIYTAFTGRIKITDPEPLVSRFCQHGHPYPWAGQECTLSTTTSSTTTPATKSEIAWKGIAFDDFSNTDIYGDSIVITDKSLVTKNGQVDPDTGTPGKGHSTDYLVLGNLSSKEGTAKGLKILSSSFNPEDGSREYYILLYTREGTNWEPVDEPSSDEPEDRDANVYFLEGPQIGTFNPDVWGSHGAYRFLNVRNRGDNDGDTKFAPHLFTLTFKDCDIEDAATQEKVADGKPVYCYVHGYSYDSQSKKYVDAGVYYYPKNGNYATVEANELSPENTEHPGPGAHWQLDECKQLQAPSDGNYFELTKGQGKSYTFSLYTSKYVKTEMEEVQDAGSNIKQMVGTRAQKPRALDTDADKTKYNYFGYHYGANSVGIDVNQSIDLTSKFQRWEGNNTDNENRRFYLIGNTGANGTQFGKDDGWRKNKAFPMTKVIYGNALNPDSVVYYATVVRGYDNTGKKLEMNGMYMTIASDYLLSQDPDGWSKNADGTKLWEDLWDLNIRPLVQGMKDACATHGALYVPHDRYIRNMNQSLNPNVPAGTQQYVLRMNTTTSTYSVDFQEAVKHYIVGPAVHGNWTDFVELKSDKTGCCYVATCQLTPGQEFRFVTNECYNETWGEDETAPTADETATGDCNYCNHVLMHETATLTPLKSYDGTNVTLPNGDKEDLGKNIVFMPNAKSKEPVTCTIRFFPANNNVGYYTIDRDITLNNVQDGTIKYTYTDKKTNKEVVEKRTIENKGDVAYITSFSSHLAYKVEGGVEAYVVSNIQTADEYASQSNTLVNEGEGDETHVAVVTLTKPMTKDIDGQLINFIPANTGVILVARSTSEDFSKIVDKNKAATTKNGYQTSTVTLRNLYGNPREGYDDASLLTSNPEGGSYTAPASNDITDDTDVIYPFGFYRKSKVVTTETDNSKFLFGFWVASEGEHTIGPNRSYLTLKGKDAMEWGIGTTYSEWSTQSSASGSVVLGKPCVLLNFEGGNSGATTAIDNVDAEQDATSEVNGPTGWFNLQGQRINRPVAPGIYIHDGKKVMVKPLTR